MSEQKWTLDRIIKVLIYIGGIVLFFLLFKYIGKYLVSFFLACILAYLFEPIVQLFMRWFKAKKRVLPVLCTLLFLMIFFTLAIMLTVPPISREFGQMRVLLSEYSSQFNWHSLIPEQLMNLENIGEDYSIQDLLSTVNAQEYLGKVFSFFGGVLSSIGSGLMSLFSIVTLVMYLVFIMLSYDKLFGNAYSMIPPMYREQGTQMIKDIEKEMVVYFRAQTLIMLCVTVLYAVGFKIIGLPLAILLGIFTGIISFVPYLQWAALIPAAWLVGIKALETGQNYGLLLLLVVAVFLAVQLIQEVVFVPWIQGKTTGLNPAIMLLSLTVWGGLFGIPGMLIALPITSFLLSYYKRFVLKQKPESSSS